MVTYFPGIESLKDNNPYPFKTSCKITDILMLKYFTVFYVFAT
jgi:hypothetical protein